MQQKSEQIKQLRKTIGWLECEVKQRERGSPWTSRKRHSANLLRTAFGDLSSIRKLRLTLDNQQGRLRVKDLQVRHTKERLERKLANAQYRLLGPKSLHAKEGNGYGIPTHQPSAEAIGKYSEGVLGVMGNHNPKDPAITEWRAAAKQVKVDPTKGEHDPEYWNYAWSVALKKARNWKARGHNGLCAFW